MLAQFKVCVQDEALKLLAPPSSRCVALVQEARDLQVVFFFSVLKFVGTEEAVDDAFDHFWRVI